MYQLIQILFQKFFSILCTNRSPSPIDFHSNETSADPHHDTDTPHQSTHAPLHTRRYVPTPPPPCRTPNRTTVPLHRTPRHAIPLPCSRTVSTPAGRPDAVSTPHRRRPRRGRRARRRRPHVDVDDGVSTSERRHAAATQAGCKYPGCRAIGPPGPIMSRASSPTTNPLVGRHPKDRKYESGTGHMPYHEDMTQEPTHARRPDFSRARTQAPLVLSACPASSWIIAQVQGPLVVDVAGRVECLILTVT